MGREFSILYNRRPLMRPRPRRNIGRANATFYLLTRDWEFCISFRPRKGFLVRARWKKGSLRTAVPLAPWRQEWPVMKKKMSKAEVTDAKHRAPVETALLHTLMPLIEHMAVTKYEDGDPRETGWVTIKVQGAAWVVQVKDPDSAMSFSAVGATVDQALETAALLLGCDEAPWEPDTWLAQKKRPKSKK